MEKKEERVEEEMKEESKTPSLLILYIELHCVGCAKKIERSISKITGVERVIIDMKQNQVLIKGVVEPQGLCDRIVKKTRREAKVLSPLPAAEGEHFPEVIASKVNGFTTVELTINMHCEVCAKQLKREILKMRGVRKVETDVNAEKVTVTGSMDANKLIDYVYSRTKKQAKFIPQPEPQQPREESKTEEINQEDAKQDEVAKPEKEQKTLEGGEDKIGGDEQIINQMTYRHQPLYVLDRIPPPQLFSDENPNACCIT